MRNRTESQLFVFGEWDLGTGQEQQMKQFVEAVRTGAPMPISLDSLVATTRATLALGESLSSGKPERV